MRVLHEALLLIQPLLRIKLKSPLPLLVLALLPLKATLPRRFQPLRFVVVWIALI